MRKGLQLKTTALLVFFLWLVKSEKRAINRIADHIEKCGRFSGFQYGFRSSRSTADLLTGRLLIYARLLTGFGMLVFFTNLSFMEFQVRYLVLFLLLSVIDGFEWF